MINEDLMIKKYLFDSSVETYIRKIHNPKKKNYAKEWIIYCTKRGKMPNYKTHKISLFDAQDVKKQLENYDIKEPVRRIL